MESTEKRLDPLAIHVMGAYCHIIDHVLEVLEKNEIKYISYNAMHHIIDMYNGHLDKYIPEDRFLAFEKPANKWIACDNSTGDCFVEEFVGISKAIDWLISEEGPVNE